MILESHEKIDNWVTQFMNLLASFAIMYEFPSLRLVAGACEARLMSDLAIALLQDNLLWGVEDW